MKEKYKKLDNNTVELTVTTTDVKVETYILSIPQLTYDRDSLLRVIDENNAANDKVNAEIKIQVNTLNEKIQKLQDLGIQPADGILGANIVVDPVVEPVVEEK